MPWPIIPVLIKVGASALALVGVKKSVDGVKKLKEAKRIGEDSKARHAKAVRSVQRSRSSVVSRATDYATLLDRVATTTFTEVRSFLHALEQKTNAREVFVPVDIDLGEMSLSEYSHKVIDPTTDLAAVIGAAGTGAAAGSTAVGLVAMFGTASTGTAIGGLGGAAATNATLAWLGGGSLAAGGGGMAAGSLVLGGIVAGPALAVGGFALDGKGEKALTSATKYAAKANKHVATLRSMEAFLKSLETRIDELGKLVGALDERARAALAALDARSFDIDSDEDMRSLQQLLQLVKASSEVMTTAILDTEGSLTPESERVLIRYRELAS